MTHPATREDLLNLVADIRPALHRYCARLTGSVLDGEDIVQEAITRAFQALGAEQELPPLRPWLFKIAHNAAVDLLKSHGRSRTELHDDITLAADAAQAEAPADPAVVRAAIARFLVLRIQSPASPCSSPAPGARFGRRIPHAHPRRTSLGAHRPQCPSLRTLHARLRPTARTQRVHPRRLELPNTGSPARFRLL